jgi:hypothetical protein
MERDAGGRTVFRYFPVTTTHEPVPIGAILEDGRGELWVSTTVGLTRVDPATGEFKSYSAKDGLLDGTYFVGSAARGADGELHFGGVNGMTSFMPDAVRDNPIRPGGDHRLPGAEPLAPAAPRRARPRSRRCLTATPYSRWNSRRCTTPTRKATASPTACRASTRTGPRPTPASASPPTPTWTRAIMCSRSAPPTRTGCGATPRRASASRSNAAVLDDLVVPAAGRAATPRRRRRHLPAAHPRAGAATERLERQVGARTAELVLQKEAAEQQKEAACRRAATSRCCPTSAAN